MSLSIFPHGMIVRELNTGSGRGTLFVGIRSLDGVTETADFAFLLIEASNAQSRDLLLSIQPLNG